MGTWRRSPPINDPTNPYQHRLRFHGNLKEYPSRNVSTVPYFMGNFGVIKWPNEFHGVLEAQSPVVDCGLTFIWHFIGLTLVWQFITWSKYLWDLLNIYLVFKCQTGNVRPIGGLTSVWHDLGLTILNLVKLSLDPVRYFFDIFFCHVKQKMSNQFVVWHLFDMTSIWQFCT